MNDEHEDLANALRTLARREPIPPAPVADLVRRGRRARRTRAVTRAAAAVTGLAAAALGVVVTLGSHPASPSGRVAAPSSANAPTSATTPSATPLDARSILLAASETAARQPATTGRYWYSKERVWSPAVRFNAIMAGTHERWDATKKGARSRFTGDTDVEFIFANPADKAKWRREGSPFIGRRTRSIDYYRQPLFVLGTHMLTISKLQRLPGEKDALAAELRRLFRQERSSYWHAKGRFTQYVWDAAESMLSGPTKPATRAALYKLLAEQPGIASLGKVKDPLGRTGVALGNTVRSGGWKEETRLIVDDDSAALLAYQVWPGKRPTLQVAYIAQGWVDHLGDRVDGG
ncbi:CU044_5270 family protein [Streptosporangiaceae bacterium NEAU-GS5]|nr:CU044_5270 family protein [Streptosporangiaceae bacterium NEAU-GS5]